MIACVWISCTGVAWGAPAPAPSSDARVRLEQIVVALEQVGSGSFKDPELKRAWQDQEMRPVLKRAFLTIDSLIARDSADVGAILLAARLERACIPYGVGWDEPEKPYASPREYWNKLLAALDRGIAAAPDNAELHYQKARACGTVLFQEYNGSGEQHPLDRLQAAASCRRAFELDSTRAEYRKFLAVFLLLGPHPEEAEPYVRGQHGELECLHALLADWAVLPIPPEATIDVEASDREQSRLYRNVMDDWSVARARVWSFAGPASQIAAFYAKAMPGFKLYPLTDFHHAARGTTNGQQIFVMRDGRYTPASSASECARLGKPWSGPKIEMVVAEFPDAPTDRATADRAAVRGPYCVLTMTNWRKPRSIDDGREPQRQATTLHRKSGPH